MCYSFAMKGQCTTLNHPLNNKIPTPYKPTPTFLQSTTQRLDRLGNERRELTANYSMHMNWLRLRYNQLKFKTAGKLLVLNDYVQKSPQTLHHSP